MRTTSPADGSVDRETLQPDGLPIPGSSRQVEASHLETGGPMDPRRFPPVPGTIRLGGMDQFASRSWTPPCQSNLDPAMVNEYESPTSPFPTIQPCPGADISYPLRA